ncbi:MAG: NapC/NirT family cytochrome c [Gammaproteobacteria bacterium]
MSADAPEPGSRLWAALWRPPRNPWLLGIPFGAVLALVAGAVLLTAFVSAVEMSSTETFCISCHEMRDNVYVEYQNTSHYSNRTGVRATCPDCHVPKSWGPKLLRKVGATFNELPHHFLGKIDTPAKFEEHRKEMAESVWASMRATDSRECRNCHAMDHMDLAVQDKSAQKKHKAALEKKDKTCIDCHQGIAHKEPQIEAAPAME